MNKDTMPALASSPQVERRAVSRPASAVLAMSDGPRAIGPSETMPSAPAAPTIAQAQNHKRVIACVLQTGWN
jgi:hypothetical protein